MFPGQSLALGANSNQSGIVDFRKIGPLLDDYVLISTICEMELNLIENPVTHQPKLVAKPEIFAKYDTWQYQSGEHSSGQRTIIGSVRVFVRTDQGKLISIRPLIISGPSGWVTARNITHSCNMRRINRIVLELPGGRVVLYHYSCWFCSFPQCNRFLRLLANLFPVFLWLSAALSASELEVLDNLAKLCRVVNHVHRHECGHATYSDMETLLCCNKLWNEHVQPCLETTFSHCINCKAFSTITPNLCVSL